MTRRTRLLAALATVVVLAAALAVPLATTEPTPAAASTPTTRTPVMGPNLLSANQLAQWYLHKRGGKKPNVPGVDNDILRLARLFIEEGRKEGVRGDIAFMQSLLETGWFTFPSYGQIRPSFNNFAGLNAYNGRPKGTTCAAETSPSRCFPSARIGVRAQIHLLRGYADASSAKLPDRLRLPPADRIGIARIWELFGGDGPLVIWATASDYGTRIIASYSEALVYWGARAECLPYFPGGSGQQSGNGYWLVDQGGGTYSFGTAGFHGTTAGMRLNQPLIGAESTSTGKGYWQLALDGGVFSFGDARFKGSTGNLRLNQPINGMERTKDDRGYWLVAYDGGVFSFGNAKFRGSTGNIHLNAPVFGMERTKSGKGYWLFALDGGIFAFGDAKFYGSLGGHPPNKWIVAMQRTPSGKGYWMMDAGGRVYRFGDAKLHGDIRGCANYHGAARLLVTPSGKGYWIATNEGTIVPFGDARRLGMPTRVLGPTVALMLRR